MIPAPIIVKLTGAPQANVEKYWPLIQVAMKEFQLARVTDHIGIVATVVTEYWKFEPRFEIGNAAYFKKMYGKRADYEVDQYGYWKWRGRGFVQLTGKANYATYGKAIGVDLLLNPDAALDPKTSARLLCAYFRLTGCDVSAAKGRWTEVREKVNGGHNGLEQFLITVGELQGYFELKDLIKAG